MKDTMLAYFKEIFEDIKDVEVYFAPGRVNLIGEHTDYNGGHVFPCALTIGTYAAVRMRQDRSLRFYSLNFKEKGVIISSLDELIYHREDDWANYPKGVLWAFAHHSASDSAPDTDYKGEGGSGDKGTCDKGSGDNGFGDNDFSDKGSGDKGSGDKVHNYNTSCFMPKYGMDIVYWGNIPNSSGLSSSASIEVLTAYIIKDMYYPDISLKDISLLCQYAENKFIGVNCGIMDQFAIAMGKKDHAIFLNTSNLSYEYAPVRLAGSRLVIACSNKKRGLGDSKYNERRSECEEALRRLQNVKPVNSLGELSEEEFEQYKHVIGDETLIRRAKHAVYENGRTVRAVKALNNGDITAFGRLMVESHESLRDDYEVTGIELDTLVESALKQEGVTGARMTGAGFGGCTVNIVEETHIESFIKEVGKTYKEKIGYNADFYVVDIGDGPVKL